MILKETDRCYPDVLVQVIVLGIVLQVTEDLSVVEEGFFLIWEGEVRELHHLLRQISSGRGSNQVRFPSILT